MTEPTPPVSSATENSTTITHQAFTRAERLAMTGFGVPLARNFRTAVMPLESTSRAPMPARR